MGPDAEFNVSRHVDLDGDGVDEALFETQDSSTDVRAGIARRTAGVWRVHAVRTGGTDEVRSTDWLPPITSAGVRYAVLHAEISQDGAATVEYSVYAMANGSVRQLLFEGDAQGTWDFEAAANGGLLIVQRGRQTLYRSLLWSPSRRTSTLTAAAPQRPAPTSPCSVALRASSHLRPAEALTGDGPEIASGTMVTLLNAGALVRRGARIYRVRVGATGAVGWLFLPATEIPATCPLTATSRP